MTISLGRPHRRASRLLKPGVKAQGPRPCLICRETIRYDRERDAFVKTATGAVDSCVPVDDIEQP